MVNENTIRSQPKGLASKTVVMQSLVQVTTFGVTIEIPHPRITTIVPATAAKKKVVKNAHPTTSNNPISSNIIFMIALQVR
ncbi:hypothetical protein UUU_36570 (plasmid) [Klebsiella pneumoniae subsp. pneumoniae DSM 30104 = JCM 1662 = NBRC 14940]|nr:hypothetical protein UUU_36570 [Klebsiella pneumoniae subsp. pneumoniae DSM 30104 = JCM 1662 = NBRC 14940]